MTARFGILTKLVVLLVLFCLIVVVQVKYDEAKVVLPAETASSNVSPELVRITDLGFNPAIASFIWAGTMPEILDLFFNGHTEYFSDLAFVNGIDPKMTYPYAFSVLTLPIVPTSSYPDALAQSYVIGKEGIATGEPDWRIPYYMAINYFLESKDIPDAAHYFDLAAQTPGVPGYAERFAINFGIEENQRTKVEELWETIYESTNDPATKARAAAYIEHYSDLDYLDSASKAYKQKFGVYPTSTDELVTKGIIPAIPQDPFGFYFAIEPDGTTGIDLTRLPPGYSSSLDDF